MSCDPFAMSIEATCSDVHDDLTSDSYHSTDRFERNMVSNIFNTRLRRNREYVESAANRTNRDGKRA